VVFTIALFFGGLAPIFRTRVRRRFLGIGSAVFHGALAYLSKLTDA
jgi:hypothetical protein